MSYKYKLYIPKNNDSKYSNEWIIFEILGSDEPEFNENIYINVCNTISYDDISASPLKLGYYKSLNNNEFLCCEIERDKNSKEYIKFKVGKKITNIVFFDIEESQDINCVYKDGFNVDITNTKKLLEYIIEGIDYKKYNFKSVIPKIIDYKTNSITYKKNWNRYEKEDYLTYLLDEDKGNYVQNKGFYENIAPTCVDTIFTILDDNELPINLIDICDVDFDVYYCNIAKIIKYLKNIDNLNDINLAIRLLYPIQNSNEKGEYSLKIIGKNNVRLNVYIKNNHVIISNKKEKKYPKNVIQFLYYYLSEILSYLIKEYDLSLSTNLYSVNYSNTEIKKILDENDDLKKEIDKLKNEITNKEQSLPKDTKSFFNKVYPFMNDVTGDYRWEYYDNPYSNYHYFNDYYEVYDKINKIFFEEINKNIERKFRGVKRDLKIAIVGGGSGIELKYLNFKKNNNSVYQNEIDFYDIEDEDFNINCTIIDKVVWPINQISCYPKNLNIKLMDLLDFLRESESFDVVIYSRILNYTELVFKKNDKYYANVKKELVNRKDTLSFLIQVEPQDKTKTHEKNEELYNLLSSEFSRLKVEYVKNKIKVPNSTFKHDLILIEKK